MITPEQIRIDEKNGKYYLIMISNEIEFTSNDLSLEKAVEIRDRKLQRFYREAKQFDLGPIIIPIIDPTHPATGPGVSDLSYFSKPATSDDSEHRL